MTFECLPDRGFIHSFYSYLEGDGLLQHVEEELQLQQGGGVGRVRGQGQEAVLLAPGDQVLLKQPGQLLQARGLEGQGAAAVQHTVTWKVERGQLSQAKPTTTVGEIHGDTTRMYTIRRVAISLDRVLAADVILYWHKMTKECCVWGCQHVLFSKGKGQHFYIH